MPLLHFFTLPFPFQLPVFLLFFCQLFSMNANLTFSRNNFLLKIYIIHIFPLLLVVFVILLYIIYFLSTHFLEGKVFFLYFLFYSILFLFHFLSGKKEKLHHYKNLYDFHVLFFLFFVPCHQCFGIK